MLADAVTAHLDERFSEAENLIRRANLPAIMEWVLSWVLKNNEFNSPRFLAASPSGVPPERDERRMPAPAVEKLVHARDGHSCLFCGIPVIRKEVRERLTTLYPESIRWGVEAKNSHAAIYAMQAQYDHVVPYSSGGRSDIDNIVLACYACNFGRNKFTLEEMGLVDPRTRPRIESDWDGLERLLQKTQI